MRVTSSAFLFLLAALGQQTTQALSSDVQGAIQRVVKYPAGVNIKPGSFIVELEGEPGSTDVRAAATSATSSFAKSVPKFIVDKQYNTLFNGYSVRADKNFDPAQLASLPGVKRVWPVKILTIPVQTSPVNITYPYLHHATGVDAVVQNLGFTGKGLKIGIIDSGVDFNHPELGNCWKTSGCMWQFGSDFVGDLYNPNDANPIITPGPYPMDCAGHGTHVAGIIAGQGPTVIGVAQDATMGMYRIFSCPVDGNVSSSDDLIISGIEAAYRDGVDIMSLSLGGGGWPEDPTAVACSNMVKKGVVVVAANGNEGAAGLFTAGSPALGQGVISVGSIDNWNNTGGAIDIIAGAGDKSISSSTPGNADVPFVFPDPVSLAGVSNSTNSNLGCATISQDLKGKVALVQRGNCTFNEKAVNAQAAGAVGVIIYNNVVGMFSPSVTDETVEIPLVLISKDDGAYAVSALTSGGVRIKAPKGSIITVPSSTAGQMSDFSSYGPGPELDMAPYISAPGGNIYSTYPLKFGGYTSMSGTSMATPYISGTVALLKQAFPSYSVSDIAQALVNAAKPRDDQTSGKKIHPYWSGGGLVNIYDAITARAQVSPSLIPINNTNHGRLSGVAGFSSSANVRWARRTVTIRNTDKRKSARISFSHSVADSLTNSNADGTFTAVPRVWPADASGSQDKSTLPQVYIPSLSGSSSVGAGKSRSVDVYIISPYGLKESGRWFYGGFLNFTLTWSGESKASSYVVPYAGFNGDYSKIDVLADPSEGLPVLTDINGKTLDSPTTFGANGTNPIAVNWRLEVPSRLVTLSLQNTKNVTKGYIVGGYNPYVPRNQQTADTYLYHGIVNGTVYSDAQGTKPVQLARGIYTVRLDALRPLGDAKSKSSCQTWVSPAFSVA
ncbi:subtilisin-like protein [Linderina pennispora]|uniref:Subtilisin-like protein n=1 Tax=Linderina pennispora TaxID=61395 RepID=A0A1Y1WMS6_9FUNG|nr:subtilisin-like protein [Linderina pennispora]ORX74870.1 subtilisin-like protein [Linderina pennispora]